MSFEDLQSKWQSHDHCMPLRIDPSLLLNEVRRSHRAMEVELWQRDFTEMVAATIVTIAFTCFAIVLREWTLFVCAIGGLYVGLFFVFDRIKQARRRSAAEQTLLSIIEASLIQVNHQIWLLKNVFWWGLLPLIPGLVAFLGSAAWQSRHEGIVGQIIIAVVGIICVATFWYIYRLNLREVRINLEPRRAELEALKASLDQSAT